MIAAIDMRGIARLVLAAQDVGDDRSETPDHQSVGIDQMPLLLHLGRLGRLGGLHQRLHGADLLRSEEHTSELQSLMRISYAVFCLKKKRTQTNKKTSITLSQQQQ